jgi:hypothetical protein
MKKPYKLKFSFKICNKSLACALILFALVAVCLQSVGAFPITTGSSNIDQLPPNVWESLERGAAAMGKVTLTYSEVQSKLPSASSTSLPTSTYLCIDQNHIFLRAVYSYLKGQNLGRPIMHEDAFDGVYFYYGTRYLIKPEYTNSILVKYLPSDHTDPEISARIFTEYLKTANFYVPDCIADFQSFSAVESRVLHDILESDSTEVKQEGEMLLVTVHIPDPLVLRARAVNLDEYRKKMEHMHMAPDQILKEADILQQMANMDKWHTVTFLLDPKYGYAAVKSEEFAPTGQKTASIDSDRWQYFESANVWLPRRSVESFYTDRFLYAAFSNSPSLLITDTLNDVSFTIATNIVFALAYNEPGAYFADRTTPEAKTNVGHQVDYTVAANTNLLRGAVSDVSQNMNRRPDIFWDCIFSILAVLPLIFIFISRKKALKNK